MPKHFMNKVAEDLYHNLRNLKPFVTESYLKDNKFCTLMKKTYVTKAVAELITDIGGEHYANFQLAWFHKNNYGIDSWKLYEKFKHLRYADPDGVPYDWTLGENDILNKVDRNIKDQTMQTGNEMFKPSIEHIVPQSLGGPRSDIRNIMILPLKVNKSLSNLTPEERSFTIKKLSSRTYKKDIEEAERLFYP